MEPSQLLKRKNEKGPHLKEPLTPPFFSLRPAPLREARKRGENTGAPGLSAAHNTPGIKHDGGLVHAADGERERVARGAQLGVHGDLVEGAEGLPPPARLAASAAARQPREELRAARARHHHHVPEVRVVAGPRRARVHQQLVRPHAELPRGGPRRRVHVALARREQDVRDRGHPVSDLHEDLGPAELASAVHEETEGSGGGCVG
ncbi:hypothetical protein F4809DRAFT_632220 [Biscogniauxia mediterranea]|nr:hypothetical protein F4809DRAFT_632220 [Biscogniauxia mediterranea]